MPLLWRTCGTRRWWAGERPLSPAGCRLLLSAVAAVRAVPCLFGFTPPTHAHPHPGPTVPDPPPPLRGVRPHGVPPCLALLPSRCTRCRPRRVLCVLPVLWCLLLLWEAYSCSLAPQASCATSFSVVLAHSRQGSSASSQVTPAGPGVSPQNSFLGSTPPGRAALAGRSPGGAVARVAPAAAPRPTTPMNPRSSPAPFRCGGNCRRRRCCWRWRCRCRPRSRRCHARRAGGSLQNSFRGPHLREGRR